ncbi:MAG TPA: hypothetical protein VK518_17255 [Puia sp.]|nr:hypothetical protein [Puia sp.]
MLEHKESSVSVYHSREYSNFRMIEGNRELNEIKINKIMKDIEAGIDVLKYYPIQVREVGDRLHIIDGQHRFYIARKLGRVIHYILLQEDQSLYNIAVINSNTEKWKTRDFINCYVNLNNEHYKELDAFMKTYGLSATLCARLLTDGQPGYGGNGNQNMEDFQRGKFEVRNRDEAKKLADICTHFNDFKHAKSANFFHAIKKIVDAGKVDIWDVIKKYNSYKDELVKQLSWKEYISNLENIYNKSLRSRVIIYE